MHKKVFFACKLSFLELGKTLSNLRQSQFIINLGLSVELILQFNIVPLNPKKNLHIHLMLIKPFNIFFIRFARNSIEIFQIHSKLFCLFFHKVFDLCLGDICWLFGFN